MKKLSVVMIMLFVGMTSSFAQSQNQVEQPVISVSGKGIVHIEPDFVVIKLGVSSSAAQALEAKTQNDKIISDVLLYVKKFKIATKDVQTQRIDLYKQKDYESKEEFFVANQSISVTLRDLNAYEDFMIGVMKSGINNIQGIEFNSTKSTQYQGQARALAVKNAQEKAKDFADALGQKVGKAIVVRDGSSYVNTPSPVMMKYAMSDSAAGGQTIAQGEIEVNAEVYIEFTLE